MTKRIIALLLALILTVGLLPTVALAEDAPKEDGQTAASGVSTVQSGTDSDNNTDNPVHVIKTFTPGEDGKFGSLTLEAYVTNPPAGRDGDCPAGYRSRPRPVRFYGLLHQL